MRHTLLKAIGEDESAHVYGCVSSIIIESALISTGTIAVYGLLSVLGERYPSWGQPCAHLLLGASAPQAVVRPTLRPILIRYFGDL